MTQDTYITKEVKDEYITKEAQIIELLDRGKPGLAIRKCVELEIPPEQFRKILRKGIRKEIWGNQTVTLCYGIVWFKRPTRTNK